MTMMISCTGSVSSFVDVLEESPSVLAIRGDVQINLANQGNFTLEGTCTIEGAQVTVTLGSFPPWTTSCTDLIWKMPVAVGIVDQITENTSTSLSVVEAGNSTPATAVVKKDITAPTIAIATNLSAINEANQGSYNVSGTCNEDGVTVTVSVGGLISRTTTCSSNSWSVSDYDATGLTISSVSITARIKDKYENSRDASAVMMNRDIVIPTVTITSTSFHINSSNETGYSLSGSCEVGEVVSLTIGTLNAQNLTCSSDSTWALTNFDTFSLIEGTGYNLVVSQTDAAGNVGSVTETFDKDTTAPTVGITSNRQVNLVNESSLTIGGSCSDSGQKVGVTIVNEMEVEVDCISLSWTYQAIDLSDAATFPEGTIAVSITHRDKVGNAVTVYDSNTALSKDITPPTLSVASNPLPIINAGNVNNYTLTGDCSGSDGNQITISVTGLSDNYQAPCEANWIVNATNLAVLAESDRTSVIVKVVDGHGNPFQVNTYFAKDVTTPVVTIDTLAEITDGTDLQNYAVSGNCSEANVSVIVDVSGVTAPTLQSTCGVSATGRWSTTVDVNNLSRVISFGAKQTDTAGNQGSASRQAIAVAEEYLYFKWQNLAVGGGHSCAVTREKKVLCWGYNGRGQLGDDSHTNSDHPVYVVDGNGSTSYLTDIVEVVAGDNHTCALKGNGKMLCWGEGGDGQLGHGGTADKDHPVYVKANSSTDLSNIVQMTTGQQHTCVLKESGKVLCWGSDTQGRLGNGSTVTTNQNYPVYVHESETSSNHLTSVVQVQAGGGHTCALSSAGQAYCWGYGNYGQLGTSNMNLNRHAPGIVLTENGGTPLSGIQEIASGVGFHSCALLEGGGVKCWGYLGSGRLGTGVTESNSEFFPVDVVAESGGSGNLSEIAQLIVGDNHNCGLTLTGGVKCWGYGRYGQLGDGGYGFVHMQSRPINVLLGRGFSTALSNVIDLARGAAGSHACAQHEEGRLLCWGYNQYGGLGDDHAIGTSSGVSYPVTVIDGDASTAALMNISTFRGTYFCAKEGSSCFADSIEFKIASGSVGMNDSVTIEVSGLTAVQTLTLYDDSGCSSSVGTLAGDVATQEISVSSLAGGAHKFRFVVIEGGIEVVPCSKNFITYVYDNMSPAELNLTVPSSSGTDTSTSVTVSGIESSHLVKLYKGNDCSAANLVATVRSDGASETMSVDNLTVGVHIFRAQAVDAAGNISACQIVGVSYEVTSILLEK